MRRPEDMNVRLKKLKNQLSIDSVFERLLLEERKRR